jgi:hypothetical protein
VAHSIYYIPCEEPSSPVIKLGENGGVSFFITPKNNTLYMEREGSWFKRTTKAQYNKWAEKSLPLV